MTFFDAALLGIIEGLTEFLPISSTGHLILISKLLGLEQTDSHKAFEVAIQFGAILAVLAVYFKKLKNNPSLIGKLAIGFLPTGILGFTLYKTIKGLFSAETVVIALIVGGIVLILSEKYLEKFPRTTTDVAEISYKQSFLIGIAQSFAMIPGTSRSGATIIGGLFAGLDRKSAVEFSFLLALPTMFAATVYDMYKNATVMANADYMMVVTGFSFAFIAAILTVKFATSFVAKHGFAAFGVYRIVLAIFFWMFIL